MAGQSDNGSTSRSSIVIEKPPSPDNTADIESYGTGEPQSLFLTGLKLAAVVVSLALVTFLITLDSSILGTVSYLSPYCAD